MNRRRRIDNFQGTDIEYIGYLESKVAQLSNLRPAPDSPPSPTPSHEGVNEESDNDAAVTFIEFDPSTLPRLAKRRRTTSLRWRIEMGEMLREISDMRDWSLKRASVGLSSSSDLLSAFDMIIHGTVVPRGPAPEPGADFCLVSHEPDSPTLRLLSSYAKATATLRIGKTFMSQIVGFRVLVFVSICCVSLYHGVEKSLIDQVMRECISDSDDKNLDRLRSGALWVNRMMATLAPTLHHRASELFVLFGRSLAQYGRFAEVGQEGFSYFVEHISASAPGPEIHASMPFLVPFFVKVVVGEIYSLQEICTALRVTELLDDEYLVYLNNYRKRQLPPSQGSWGRATKSLSDAPQGTPHSRQDATGAEDSVNTFDSLHALLRGAQETVEFIPESILDQQSLGGETLLDGSRMGNTAPQQIVIQPPAAYMTSSDPSTDFFTEWEPFDVLNDSVGLFDVGWDAFES